METGTVEIEHGAWKGKLSGIDTKAVLLAVLIVVCLGVFAWVVADGRQWDSESRKAYLDQHKVTQSMLSTIIENQAKAQGDIGEISYILSLDQASREKLNLQMPETLRRKVNGR